MNSKLLLHLLCLILFTMMRSSSLPFCHESERSALLELKQSFTINKLDSTSPSAYPKTSSWKAVDCCLWDGVECDQSTGHVISLDLSSSYLHGPIKPNSTIFHLSFLQMLNLSDNNFIHSSIPSGISQLSSLKHLNLSQSSLSGEVPDEFSMLSSLVSLDLSDNSEPFLQLPGPGLGNLVQKWRNLEVLRLSTVNISSQVPQVLANLTSLTTLILVDCGLKGLFPKDVFQLPNLQTLSLSDNPDLAGSFPEFQTGSELQVLKLGNSSFGGSIPSSLGKLRQLRLLDLGDCYFEGPIPGSLGDLTQLSELGLNLNQFTGEIPSSMASLTQLTFLDLSGNSLNGSIPNWISTLENLDTLSLGSNNFTSPVDFSIFLQLGKLTYLSLSDVELTFPSVINHSDNNLPQFEILVLTACNLTEFPDFLQTQNYLITLFLPENNIQGTMPQWMWNVSTETMFAIVLGDNALTSFGNHPKILPWPNLGVLQLDSNLLHGSFPLPSPSLAFYNLYGNQLSGDIPSLICNSTSLFLLDLSYNNFTGEFPSCLSNFSSSFMFLDLEFNDLEGKIPDSFTESCNLRSISISGNRLTGEIPRSLINCSSLRLIDLSYNQIEDVFPVWVGDLPELRILVLGSNKLHGRIQGSGVGPGFSQLQIFDLSDNDFTGDLPREIFLRSLGMQNQDQHNASYLEDILFRTASGRSWEFTYDYTTSIRNKGKETLYFKLLNIFLYIDLSSNRFGGEIPASLGSLVGIQALNLSNNNLVGSIPPSLGKLMKLESLDLSGNMLSGAIPQQLTGLTFLALFNVSNNRLSGAIPLGNQFATFSNESFLGNGRLCGSPLGRKCVSSMDREPLEVEEEADSRLVDRIIIGLGYLSGLVVGLIFGRILTNKKHEWFVRVLGGRKSRKRRGRGIDTQYLRWL